MPQELLLGQTMVDIELMDADDLGTVLKKFRNDQKHKREENETS